MATTPYAAVTFADAYFLERLDTDAWDTPAPTDAIKLKALKQATRELDVLEYAGNKTDADQANEFPRNAETEIPAAVKNACCEVAIALLEGKTLKAAFEQGEAQSESTGDASTTFRKKGIGTVMEEAGGLPSQMAYRYIREFLADPSEFAILRTG